MRTERELETQSTWADLLPSVPTGELNEPVTLTMKDGSEHEAVLQFFDQISAPVLETRIIAALEGEGWVRDGEYFLHRDGYVISLAFDSPKVDRTLVMYLRVDP